MSFASWTQQLDDYLGQQTAKDESPFSKHVFHLIWADPGFWCQLGTFVVAGVLFRMLGFGDGVHNGVLLDVSTFTIGFYLAVAFSKHLPVYTPREQAGSALNYAHKNFPTRMVFVPFTSTFVPLLYGYKTASAENIAACWVQHFVALMASYWSLAPTVVNRRADLSGRPYAYAARRVEDLKVRVAAAGAFADASKGSLEAFARGRGAVPVKTVETAHVLPPVSPGMVAAARDRLAQMSAHGPGPDNPEAFVRESVRGLQHSAAAAAQSAAQRGVAPHPGTTI